MCLIPTHFKLLLLRMKWVFKHKNLQMFGHKVNKYGYFHPFEVVSRVVSRGSETQLQIGKFFFIM